MTRHERRLHGGDEREREPVPREEVASCDRRRQQPLERSGRPLAQHRDRGDDEHRHEREEPEERDAERLEDLWSVLRTARGRGPGGRTGTTISSAIVRGSWRSCRSTRRAVARVRRVLMPSLRGRRRARGTRRRDRSFPSSPAARRACRLPASVPPRRRSRRSQRSASSMTWLETRTVAPAVASPWNVFHRSRRSTGSSPTVGSSSTSSSGSLRRAARARAAPARPPDSVPATCARARRAPRRSSVSGPGAADAEDRAK